jgi:hypothetical protein
MLLQVLEEGSIYVKTFEFLGNIFTSFQTLKLWSKEWHGILTSYGVCRLMQLLPEFRSQKRLGYLSPTERPAQLSKISLPIPQGPSSHVFFATQKFLSSIFS